MGSRPLEVLLVDDQLGVRRGTELLLRDAGHRVAGLAASESEAAGLLRRRRHDVALVDTLIATRPTATLLGELLSERPDAPVIVYAGRDADALAAAVAVDPPGIVLKSSASTTLLQAIDTVAAGGRFADPRVPRRAPRQIVRSRAGIELLSPREREILGLLAEGLSGAEVAERLYLSAETVRTHVRNAVAKLGCRTRTQAVAMLVGASAGVRVPGR